MVLENRSLVDDAKSAVRVSIETLLRDFIAAPLLNAREKDYQAVLFSMLRVRIPGQVPATFEITEGRANTRHTWSEPRTSRVHLEMCFGSKGRAGEWTKPDIVVLRDRPVILRCSVDGPADIQETLRVEDVEVAIELKAAPSQNLGEAAKFAVDVAKLAKVQCKFPDLHCFAAVIDKSISVPCASSSAMRIADWLGMVNSELCRNVTRPDEPHVEVWFIDPQSLAPCHAFFTAAARA